VFPGSVVPPMGSMPADLNSAQVGTMQPVTTGMTPLGGGPVVEASLQNVNSIICPFLSALVKEGVLPVRSAYTREELQQITLQSGLEPTLAQAHVDGNFVNQPTGVQDIFNMEGAPNEHDLSTGINDCKTTFTNCQGPEGNRMCTTFTARECKLPNAVIFEEFFAVVDVNKDGIMTRAELEDPSLLVGAGRRLQAAAAGTFPVVDANPIGGGTIPGSFGLILNIFGETQDQMSKEALRVLVVDRRFPPGFVFPGSVVPPMGSMPADLNSARSELNHSGFPLIAFPSTGVISVGLALTVISVAAVAVSKFSRKRSDVNTEELQALSSSLQEE